MPVRSLTSPVLRWPDAATVDAAVRRWAAEAGAQRPEVSRIAYFGSYARGDWGVGSDLDILVLVNSSEAPFARRSAGWDATGLPVPADVLVYTVEEWRAIAGRRFHDVIEREAVWVLDRSR